MKIDFNSNEHIEANICPLISTLEVILIGSIPSLVGLINLHAKGAFDIYSFGFSTLVAALIFLFFWISRKDKVVIRIKAKDCPKVKDIFSFTSDSDTSAGSSRCIGWKPYDFLIRAILDISKLVIFVGNVKLPYPTDRHPVDEIGDEWLSSVENSSLRESRVLAALYTVPDALVMVYEFGFIERIRTYLSSKINSNKKCSCGKDNCTNNCTINHSDDT